jgi:hypothetical protein
MSNYAPDFNNKEHRDAITRNLANSGNGVIEDACDMIEAMEQQLARLTRENEELRAKSKPRPMSEWHEDIGPVLWFPDVKTWEDVECIESAYFGTPLDSFAPAEEMEWWVPFPDFSNVVKDPTPGGPHA